MPLPFRWPQYPKYYMRESYLWSFNETIVSDTGLTFNYVRQSVAYDNGGTLVNANTPVYEVI